jgi:hypothetical protein
MPQVQPVALKYPTNPGYEVTAADLVDPDAPWRHESKKLAEQIMRYFQD